MEKALSRNEIRRLSKLFTFPAKDNRYQSERCPLPLFISFFLRNKGL